MILTRTAAVGLVFGLAQNTAIAASASFSDVVAEILRGQKDGQISEMADDKKQAMIDCVSGVLAELPKGKKKYVLEGGKLRRA